MSTLNVANVTDGTTTVSTSYVVNGSAKAWCLFNGSGTAAIRDSLNHSSVTDNGTGDFTLSYTNSFAAAQEYTCGGGVSSNGSPSNDIIRMLQPRTGTEVLTGSTRFFSRYVTANSASAGDYEYSINVCHGDLA